MSSIIKNGYIKQGSIINLQERMQFTYLNDLSSSQDSIQNATEVIEKVSEINYDELYEQALEQKEAILLQARQEAEEIIAKAYEKVSLLEEQKVKQVEEMICNAKEQADSIINSSKTEAHQLIEEAYYQKQEILNEAEPEIVDIIKVLVGHIIHEEVANGNKWISYIVKKMIAKEKLLGDLVVYLAPNVIDSLTEEELQEFNSIKNQITLEPDEELNDKTCMVETIEGSILYDLSGGIDKVIKDLTALGQIKVEEVYD